MAVKSKSYSKKKQQNKTSHKNKNTKSNSEVTSTNKTSVFSIKFGKFMSLWKIWSIIPVLVIVGIVPLIVYARIIELTPLEQRNWTGGSYQIDFFNFYKSKWLVILTIFLIAIFVSLWITKRIEIKNKKIIIPLGLYLIFVTTSTIFALDQTVALRGFMGMFQGYYVLISYAFIVFILAQLVRNDLQVKMIIGAYIFLGIIIGILGFYQYIGKDPFQTDAGIKLILPNYLEPIANEMSNIFGGFNIYATMGNTNFVGSYAALMIPLAFVLYLYSKKLIYQVFNIIFLGLMLLVGYGSNSRAGIIGIIVSLLMVIIIFRQMFLYKPFKILFPFVLMAGVGLVLNIATEGKVIKEIQSINIFKAIEEARAYADNRVFITRLEIEDDTLFLETEEEGIILKWMSNGLWPYSLDGEILEVVVSDRNVTFVNEAYKDFTIRIFDDRNAFTITAYGRSFDLYTTSEGLQVLSNSGFLDQPIMPDRVESLDDYGILFSNRAFIWSRSIPLLKDYFFIGSGPDNYPMAYPQNDVAGKLNYMGIYTIVDKPHNMYIQTGVNTGVLSLIALIALFIIYLIQSLKLYIKRFEYNYLNMIGSGIFLGIVAYLATGLFNDQRVSVAPLFYVMLGLGFAINGMINVKQEVIE